MHTLIREQPINASSQTLWQFIATPANLDLLTPPDLQFQILSEIPREMGEGLQLRYRIRIPWFGRWHWLTEISRIEPGVSFVDEQLQGPYRFWRHFHEIRPQSDGRCLMRDQVSYQLPLGPLGRLLHGLVVRPMLERIFDYRAQRLRELFPG